MAGIIALCAAVFAYALHAQENMELDTDDKKFSYAVGSRIGQQLFQQFGSQPGVDMAVLVQGIFSAVPGSESLLSEPEIIAVIQARQQLQLEAAEAESRAKAESVQAFLQQNQAMEGVNVTDSGLQYRILESGEETGLSPSTSDTVVVHYRGTLIDGTVFDSSYSRGEPATFSLQSIIPGWQEGWQLMRPGDKWSIVLPSELGYGERGTGQTIGPNEVLLFDIELMEVRVSGN